MKNHWDSDLLQYHGKIIELHKKKLKFVKTTRDHGKTVKIRTSYSWENNWISNQTKCIRNACYIILSNILFFKLNIRTSDLKSFECQNGYKDFEENCLRQIWHGAGPLHELTWIITLLSHVHFKVWDGITYPTPNLNGIAIVFWECVSNFTPGISPHNLQGLWLFIHAGSKLIDVNTLWSIDVIWQHRSGLTLAQVMACCLTAPTIILWNIWCYPSIHECGMYW